MSITIEDIRAARTRIAGHVRRTPLAPSSWLSDATGGQILLKAESLQTTSSFKLRGALNAIGALVERTQGPPPRVVTASAGNHGRAMAWAAEHLGVALTVFTSREAPRTKRDAIRRHGADLEDTAPTYDDAERLAKTFARETNATFISPYNHADVIAGAGTIGLELVEDAPEAGQILVPVGGGGLVSGIAIAVKSLAPATQVIGVEVEASHPFQTSLAAGRITEITVGDTIADGLSGNLDHDTMTFAIVRDRVDTTVLVSEAALRRGIRGLVAHEHLIAEGAGIAAVAALLERRVEPGSDPAVALVSGANIDFDRLQGILAEA
ncbi:MAG: threonine/serine dehydratase [Vicinamibacterales bacterium]|jgi:threonine dehydratase|nr:hydroxyectoine utilization dehydratase EutB [Acidobacteriota bacterium]MDP7294402.1 threonine/serine dehydratase [Vicinamibacterales bacterium]MDP7471233.1 threonine/serine dehydratase [Vicinamibacterales bacterium]MDP7672630.1 threonine/serine dehydratase [Vicinamibacterales bacterium]HJO36986.1 threonine/serine dehydratase [Vicinamibacterales bacterium]|tara:strand:- start:2396 stop:3364 length:969 start_codon:yes stop_codon:yes gene_type:complete